jgi:hypothetical protein
VAGPGVTGLSISVEKQRRIDQAIAGGVSYLKGTLADIDSGKLPCEDLSGLVPKDTERDFKNVLGSRMRRPFCWRFVGLGRTAGPGQDARRPPPNLVFGLNVSERPAVAGRYLLEGYLALLGWALLESGVPRTDPTVRNLAAVVRDQVPVTVDHFSVAVTLLFLDRVGDGRDDDLCRSCALRLVASQGVRSDWTTIPLCSPLNTPDERQLLKLLKAAARGKEGEVADVPLEPYLKLLPVCQALGGQTVRAPVTDPDAGGPVCSDSHFVQLALAAARRRRLPVQPSLGLLARCYRRLQLSSGAFGEPRKNGRATYGWTLGSTTWFTSQPFDRCWTRSMSCAALTGLALARDGRLDTADPVVSKGFQHYLEASAKDPPRGWAPWHRGLVYALWSEKVLATTCDLPKLGQRDWYGEATDLLLRTQRLDGSWDDQFLPPPLATCFALMTLAPGRRR